MYLHDYRAWKRTTIIVALLLGVSVSAFGQQMEQSVKAAFLYHFTKYVNWPAGTFPSSSSPFVIGIVGRDELGGALDQAVGGKSVDGRPLVVRHYKWGQDLSTCQILFVPSGETGNAGELARTKGKPVLIVGESPGFGRRFGSINFVIQSDRVRFEINAQAARENGLTISSKLLNLGIPAQ